MTVPNQSFQMYSGNSKKLVITIKDVKGKPVNLTDVEVKWILSQKGKQICVKTTNSGVTIQDALNGIAIVDLKPEDTKNLIGDHNHEVMVVIMMVEHIQF